MATAAYAHYPTPPPTISPKDYDRDRRNHSPSQYRTYSPQPQTPRGARDSYYAYDPATNYSPPGSPSHHQPQTRWDEPPHTPYDNRQQQEQYSYHLPQQYQHQYQNQQSPPHTQQQSYDLVTYKPPRSSSPLIQKQPPQSQRYLPNTNSNIYNPSSERTPRSPPPSNKPRSPHRPPKPIHFSPLNPLPTPYSVSRPTPRPGLLKRLLTKLKNLTKRFLSWCRLHPIKAALLTALPILATSAVFGLVSSTAKVLSAAGVVLMEGMGGGRTPGNWLGEARDVVKEGKEKVDKVKGEFKDAKDDAKIAAEKQAKEWGWGYGIDDFVGMGGAKGGPIEGFVKVMQMMVNHYCKLTPSAVPRALSILLELYFLDQIKR